MKNVHAVALGRKGGQVKSAAKAAAARANGKKGGPATHTTHRTVKDTAMKILKVLLIVGALLGSVQTASAGPLRYLALGAIGADLGSTAIGIARGAHEANPMGVPAIVATDGALFLATWKLEKAHPAIAKWLYVAMIGARSFAVSHNLKTTTIGR